MDARTCKREGGRWDSDKKVCDFGLQKREFETWNIDGNNLHVYNAKDEHVAKFMMNHIINEFLEGRGFVYSED